MTFKHLFAGKSLLASTACLALIACSGGDTTKTADVSDGTGPTACPADQILTDVTAFAGDDTPTASEDYAAWHAANGKRKGVVTLESGLQYKIVKKGLKNSPSPLGAQRILANYHGYFPNGEIFDSSFERGEAMEHNANGFIKGWNEALAMMQPCSAWTLYVPGNIAYGPKGRGSIPPNATLIFNMQLIELK